MRKFYCMTKDTEWQKRYDIVQYSRLTHLAQEYVPITGKIVKELCRSHLPSIFPWSKLKQERRKMLKASQEEKEKHSKRRKRSSSPEPVVMEVIEPTESPQLQISLKSQHRQIFSAKKTRTKNSKRKAI